MRVWFDGWIRDLEEIKFVQSFLGHLYYLK
jgi:hypothetical protein